MFSGISRSNGTSKSKQTSKSMNSSSYTPTSSANSESEKRATEIRDFQSSIPENKQCFDCGQRGPTYLNMTVGSFVCTKCSGMLRGINPPHRIKSLSMSSFSAEEVQFIKSRGNIWASKVYLGLYDQSRRSYDTKDDEGVKDFIIEKYEKKRYYVDPSTITMSPLPTSPKAPRNANQNKGPNLIGATLNTALSAKKGKTDSGNSTESAAVRRPPGGNSVNGVANANSVTTPGNFLASSFTAKANNPPQITPDPFSPTSSAANNKSGSLASQEGTDFFANFDSAKFDPPKVEPSVPVKATVEPILAAQKHLKSSAIASKQLEDAKAQQDKYAALKDLDELFKSTSITSDSPTPAMSSSGMSIFDTNNSFGSRNANSSPLTTSVAHPGAAASSTFPGFDAFQTTPSSSATAWPNSSNSSSSTTPSMQWPGMSNSNSSNLNGGTADWATGWPKQNGTKSPPANPFAGTSGINQLNTSPWPNSNNSPVNQPPTSKSSNQSNLMADPFSNDFFASSNFQSGGKKDFFNGGPTSENNIFDASSANGSDNANFEAFFQTISSSVSPPPPVVSENTFNDPWTQKQQQKKKTNPFL